MKQEPRKPALEFPCDFPLKAMGANSDQFEDLVVSLVKNHLTEHQIVEVSSRPSKEGKYLSVTVRFTAHSQDQLDAIFLELNNDKQVLMVL